MSHRNYISPIEWKIGDQLQLAGHLEEIASDGTATNEDLTPYSIAAQARLDDNTPLGDFTIALLSATDGLFELSVDTDTWEEGRVLVDVQLTLSGVRVSSQTLIFLMQKDITQV